MESGSQSLPLLPETTQLPSAAVPEATYTPAPFSSLTVPPVMFSPTSATTPSSPASMYTVRRQQPPETGRLSQGLEMDIASVPGSASITTVPACTASMCTDRVMCRAAPTANPPCHCTPTGPNVYVPAATMMWLTDVSATAAARPDTSLTSSGCGGGVGGVGGEGGEGGEGGGEVDVDEPSTDLEPSIVAAPNSGAGDDGEVAAPTHPSTQKAASHLSRRGRITCGADHAVREVPRGGR